ncbi:Thiol-disulfide isomerase or thioredoxin [Candidatus Hydrogenisulfobacillus filiaventi]|uniref:Thiol-disulfide isomerase or thioredoxin n=1 Tax=Candidatus Hydrogenisulfobacillus filiaventi TaxID=2707344 RepID=A0A6F8ZHF8_9FIRM|nr:TlpA disulfide reductase family protein [Bacillota bacterium]CAB1129153.1 Thiol-disulfide isomerase or thioredoxin [Candidatus Hydrogenisulfobacillus filiaventi]
MDWRRVAGGAAVIAAVAYGGYLIGHGPGRPARTGSSPAAAAPAAGSGGQAASAAGVLAPGQPAPPFTLPATNGQPVSLASLRGQPVWLNFWATWCPPCRAEIPDLEQVARRYQGRFRLIGINLEENPATVRSFMAAHGMNYPVLLDSTGEVAANYGVTAIPTSVFISPQGRILAVRVGGFFSTAQMQPYIHQLLSSR